MRKDKLVRIDAAGRDQGKTFLVVEMPPRKAEKWAARALLALGRADLPDEWKEAGMAGLAMVGIRAFLSMPFDLAEPLLDEMLECVYAVPDASKIDQFTKKPIVRALIEDDIDEVATLLALRSEVFELHTGFSTAAFLSTLGDKAKAALNSPDTSTSPKPSEQSSGTGSQP